MHNLCMIPFFCIFLVVLIFSCGVIGIGQMEITGHTAYEI